MERPLRVMLKVAVFETAGDLTEVRLVLLLLLVVMVRTGMLDGRVRVEGLGRIDSARLAVKGGVMSQEMRVSDRWARIHNDNLACRGMIALIGGLS